MRQPMALIAVFAISGAMIGEYHTKYGSFPFSESLKQPTELTVRIAKRRSLRLNRVHFRTRHEIMIRSMNRRYVHKQKQTLTLIRILQQLERMVDLMFGRARIRHSERHSPVALLKIAGEHFGQRNFLVKKMTPPMQIVR